IRLLWYGRSTAIDPENCLCPTASSTLHTAVPLFTTRSLIKFSAATEYSTVRIESLVTPMVTELSVISTPVIETDSAGTWTGFPPSSPQPVSQIDANHAIVNKDTLKPVTIFRN